MPLSDEDRWDGALRAAQVHRSNVKRLAFLLRLPYEDAESEYAIFVFRLLAKYDETRASMNTFIHGSFRYHCIQIRRCGYVPLLYVPEQDMPPTSDEGSAARLIELGTDVSRLLASVSLTDKQAAALSAFAVDSVTQEIPRQRRHHHRKRGLEKLRRASGRGGVR